MSSRIILLTVCAIGFAFGPGCSSLTKDKGHKKDSTLETLQFWKKGYQQPQKMAVLWSHDVLTIAGKPPTRGFGGRIYFYNNKSQAIPVEGELVVHGFDETAKRRTGAPENQADKRFRFTEEQFTSHFSESDLGASYSVWIPWDTADGVQKEITLVPTFKSSKGDLVQGDAAKVVLPGRANPKDNFANPVQTVSYEHSTTPTADGPLPRIGATTSEQKSGGMRTTTIQVGSSLHSKQRAHNSDGDLVASSTSAAALASASPAAASALDQARAQMIADAFRQTDAPAPRSAPSYTAWKPRNVPMSGTISQNSNNLMPTPWTQTGARPGTPSVPAAQVAPTQESPSGQSDEGYTLPPGVQLSPRGTAW